MKKIVLNANNLIVLAKKYSIPVIIVIFSGLIIMDGIIIFNQIREKAIDPAKIISREIKVDQSGYDEVIAADQKRKQSDINFSQQKNPF